MRTLLFSLLALTLVSCTAPATQQAVVESDALFAVSAQGGKVIAALPDEADADGVLLRVIHAGRLTSGLGSNPVGLDRGGLGESGRILAFRRVGDRVVLEQENWRYRASSDNAMERRAVRESFAPSVLASVPVVDGPGTSVDLTDFLTGDTLGIAQHLKTAGQGSFSLDADRTYVAPDGVLAFSDNVEVDVVTTLSSSEPGREVATTAASGRDITLVVHHSFVRLPDDGYQPLEADPRSGALEIVHYDYSAPLSAPIERRLAVRHRIRRDADGNVVPITYYIDGGAPEPVRSALIDGARWWEAAFERAGHPGAYRVEVLPADVHPLDARYNVIQWVHRQTRGWSYGGGLLDPRTGERLKGHVNLGSLRVRQDRMIFEGLLGADKTDTGAADDPVQLALARIRQLSAHEVGHSLGFAHNFAASTDGKASVMDYPAPDVRLVDGRLDVSGAYGVGLGEWDLVSADWLYGDHTDTQRDQLLDEAYADGLSYVADIHGRGVGAAHPEGSTWDNGADPVEALNEAMRVRAHALSRFGPDNLPEGRNQADLADALVPIYLYHRYQVAAASKLIGGMTFIYGPATDNSVAQVVPRARQEAALDALLATLEPGALDLPDDLLTRLTPRLHSYSFADSDRERFAATAGPAFDVASAADVAASLTLDALLHPERLARISEFHRRDPSQMSLERYFDRVAGAVFGARVDSRTRPVAQAVEARMIAKLMDLVDGDAPLGVRVQASAAMDDAYRRLSNGQDDHARFLLEMIRQGARQRESRDAPLLGDAPRVPPGSPIGSGP